MLSQGDRRLVERDAELPGLAVVLDADAVIDSLRHLAPEADVRGARACYVRYKPATSCLAVYDVECVGGPIRVTAKAYRPPAVGKIEKAQRIVDLPSALGRAAFVLNDATVVLTVFPYDLQIRPLRHLMGPSRFRVLDPLLPDLGSEVAVSVLSYKAERRCVARVDGQDARAVVRVYSKAEYAAGAGRRIDAQVRSVRLARTLAQHPKYPVVATEWLDGEVGTVVLTAPLRARAIGEALASLHEAGGETGIAWTRSADDEIRQILDVARGLADLLPKSASRIHFLSRALSDAVSGSGVGTPHLLTHGDFAMQQAVFTSDGVGLTDLDQAAMAHPATDIGAFIADLEYRGLVGSIPQHLVTEIAASFLDGYGAVRALPSGIDVYTAAQLLQRAPLPFRTRMPEWPDRVDRVIDRCESLPWRVSAGSDTHESRHSVATTPLQTSPAHTFDAVMPWLDAALDTALVGQLFADAPWGGAGISVESANLVRHKPGRRALVRYELLGSTHRAVMGKTRGKGLDRRTARLNESLYKHEFSTESADGIEVPPFLGLVPELRMWLQAEVPGESAAASLRARDLSIVSRLPDVFLKLQRVGPQPARTHTIADELRILDQRLCALALRRQYWRERLTRLLQGCVSLASSLAFAPLVPAHRDFYPEQLIVHGDRMIVLDLDLYSLAHPALDAGNCLAHAIELGMRPDTNGSAISDSVGVLRDAIGRALPETWRAADVFTTLTLARLIEIDDRLDRRRACVEPLMELCEARLSQARELPPMPNRINVPAW